ncbi:hypothetical protein HER32_00200 [Hymenobacter sp. BT18]|uniref:hypothetical protein n=1 Tax=Hymenobacter sp. BT18 TaxID=2835648 RepID=UPI00143E3738|nr:hypothetical protein [Hymenobacter sp. BT18]QIX59696.1 hypothetical protein HER32_00200 [Hymenobacter sp. BT18]
MPTFLTDTKASKKLGSIRADRLQAYRDFFMEGGPDLLEEVRKEQAATEQPAPTPAEA